MAKHLAKLKFTVWEKMQQILHFSESHLTFSTFLSFFLSYFPSFLPSYLSPIYCQGQIKTPTDPWVHQDLNWTQYNDPLTENQSSLILFRNAATETLLCVSVGRAVVSLGVCVCVNVLVSKCCCECFSVNHSIQCVFRV